MSKAGAVLLAGLCCSALFLASCGDNSSSDVADVTTTTAAASTTERKTTTVGDSGSNGHFCSTFGDHAVEITGVGVGVEPAELERAFTDLGPALDDLDAQAPPELVANVEALTGHLRTYAVVLSKYGWDFDRVTAEGSKDEQSTLSGGGPVADFQAVIDYVKRSCPGVTIPE